MPKVNLLSPASIDIVKKKKLKKILIVFVRRFKVLLKFIRLF